MCRQQNFPIVYFNTLLYMRKQNFLSALICCVILAATFSCAPTDSPRRQNFDEGWRFCLGSIEGAEAPDYDDSAWRLLDLPHDWSVEPVVAPDSVETIGPFSRASVGGTATGHTVGGEGWYRKSFTLSESDIKKRQTLYFEGAYNQTEVWVNGKRVGENVYGYSAFRFDITDFCHKAGEENVVAVRVVNEGRNSRWYAGSGIYRHVWLEQYPVQHLDAWELFIRTDSIDSLGTAWISLSVGTINELDTLAEGHLQVALVAPDGAIVAEAVASQLWSGKEVQQTELSFNIAQPLLWSAETPQRYRAEVVLTTSEGNSDALSVPFGIRTIEFAADKGMLVNGVPTLLRGGCVHHDHGLLGAAAYDAAEERKVRLLKEQGYNALRGSHNPMSEHFMTVCDSLGMYVIDEAFDSWQLKKNKVDYHMYFNEWSKRDLQTLVRRDRNHPSVIMYSIGNEIRERNQPRGKKVAMQLRKYIHEYDTTRPITAGINGEWDKTRTYRMPLDTAWSYQDVKGGNYMWYNYEMEHKKNPDYVFYGSESVIGDYVGYWTKVETLPYVIGDFSWTAMDYLGEAGIGNTQVVQAEENVHYFMPWPWFNGWCGDIDLLGVKKPQSYYRDIIWRQRHITMSTQPVVQTAAGQVSRVSFWGWPDERLTWTYSDSLVGRDISVSVYARASRIKLMLNDSVCGVCDVDTMMRARFTVPYAPGTLRAVAEGGDADGEIVELHTYGTPSHLHLSVDKPILCSEKTDLAYVLIELQDAGGHRLYDSERKIGFECQGAGEVIAAGNGSPSDMESFCSETPRLYDGHAMVIVKTRPGTRGDIRLRVSAEGLPDASITIPCR